MADLEPSDLPAAVLARFDDDDDEAQAAIDAALTTARRYCGWHVSPVRTESVVIDGPRLRLLVLPTLRLVELTTITENGEPVDVSTDVHVSALGLVRKKDNGCWAGNFGAIEVTMTHGFDNAADFFAAVLSIVDRSSLTQVGGHPIVVGPFQYGTETMSASSAFSAVEQSMLDHYRIELSP